MHSTASAYTARVRLGLWQQRAGVFHEREPQHLRFTHALSLPTAAATAGLRQGRGDRAAEYLRVYQRSLRETNFLKFVLLARVKGQ